MSTDDAINERSFDCLSEKCIIALYKNNHQDFEFITSV